VQKEAGSATSQIKVVAPETVGNWRPGHLADTGDGTDRFFGGGDCFGSQSTMGIVYTSGHVRGPAGEADVEFLVNSGAT
jgi:hypothetical protein